MSAGYWNGLLSQRAQGWYSNSSHTSSETILIDAFAKGKQAFKKFLNADERNEAWIDGQTSIQDVVQAIGDARDKYEGRNSSKAWKWLAQFSATVNHYGAILDVMVQHHPEYAALAWGAMKLLFVGVQSHEESVHQLAKALYRFADCLPRQELKLVLYPSSHMQEAVARLYAHLIEFMVHALHWYEKGKMRRAIGAIFKPFVLDFQDQLTKVDEISRSIDEIANTAAQAELRIVHTEVEDVNNKLSLARMEIKRLSDLVSFQADRLFQIASCTQTLSSQVQLDIHAQTTMIRTVQLNQIMSAPFMTDLPSSGQSLNYCSTFARRQPQSVTLAQPEIEVLRRCSLDNEISYVVLETRSRDDSKGLLLSLLQQIQAAPKSVIWALRFSDFEKRCPSLEDIIRILVLHALEINNDALASTAFPITFSSLRAASSQSEWLSILNRALSGLEEVYIIIDPDLLRFAAEENSCSAVDLILALKQGVTTSRLKIIVSSMGINKSYFIRHSKAGSWRVVRSENSQYQRLAKMKRQHLARVRKLRK